jgi:UTP--glucose-1-phosphate uridylyltransferase
MRAEGLPDAAIDTFAHNYRRLAEGEQGMLPESELEPVEEVEDASALPEPGEEGRAALDRTVVIKLNGGLGTSMGMTRAKSLLEVKDGLSFLDLIARQVLDLRERFGARLPLVLMNSFRTRDDSLEALARYPDLEVDVPLDFLEGKVPKLLADELAPVSWPDTREHEWTPPGHGDIYTSLAGTGMLERLVDSGYEYAFISNSDNLGAVVEPRVLAWFAREQLPFAMEVCERTESDKKGGHIARQKGDGLVLRETAQTPDEDLEAFEDTRRHPYFNTNNLWVSLSALKAALAERDGVLGLPMIVNRKTVDPADPSSPEVLQLETAMGAAIGEFEDAAAVLVPRGRFVPVKKTSDLLVVRSDAYALTDGARVELAPEREGHPPLVDLDDDHFKLLADFEERFELGPPSLRECDRLSVAGDVAFGRDVTVRGTVTIEHSGEGQLRIEDGAVLEG